MTRIKICGITSLDDARLAVELGAWAIGLVFHPGSPRRCELGDAEEIASQLRRRTLVTGVFVNAPMDELALVAERCQLGMLQLHGDEGPAFCREAARRTGAKVMKAARVSDASAVRALQPFRVDYHLLDAHSPDRFGGTGETFEWELAAAHDRSVPVVLSGGLTSDNVGAAMAAAGPYAVDTASGTEAAPGRKDERKLRAFFRAVSATDAAGGDEASDGTRAPGATAAGT